MTMSGLFWGYDTVDRFVIPFSLISGSLATGYALWKAHEQKDAEKAKQLRVIALGTGAMTAITLAYGQKRILYNHYKHLMQHNSKNATDVNGILGAVNRLVIYLYGA